MSLLLLFRDNGSAPPTSQTLTAARFDNASTFYSATATPGAVTLSLARYDNSQAFYTPSVTQTAASQGIQPGLYSNGQTFYPSSVTSLATLTASRFDNAQTFSTHTLTSSVTLSAVMYDNGQAFYSAQLNQSVAPSLSVNSQEFYSHVVSQTGGSQALILPLWENQNTLFTPKLTQFITFQDWVEPGWVEPGWVGWPYFNINQFFGAEVTQPDQVSLNRPGFEMGGRKVYIKRGKKIHIFDTVEDADAWVAAEEQARAVIAKAQGKKKSKSKVYKAIDEQVPHEVIRLDWLQTLIAHFNIPVELPSLEAKQDWMEVGRIALLAQQMQDDEDIEMLLMA